MSQVAVLHFCLFEGTGCKSRNWGGGAEVREQQSEVRHVVPCQQDRCSSTSSVRDPRFASVYVFPGPAGGRRLHVSTPWGSTPTRHDSETVPTLSRHSFDMHPLLCGRKWTQNCQHSALSVAKVVLHAFAPEVVGETGVAMRARIGALDGRGAYTFRCEVVGQDSAATFEVTIAGIPPPVAQILAPARASPSCDAVLDASGSADPGGAALSFAWSCAGSAEASAALSDVQACGRAAAAAAGPELSIPAGTLGIGAFVFTATATRADGASGVAAATVIFDAAVGVPPPAVSVGSVDARVSPQLPLGVAAKITESGSCRAPGWQAWWMLGLDSSGNVNASEAALVSSTQNGTGRLTIQPPLPATPGGRYMLRLILADSKLSSWAPDGTGSSFFTFDTNIFTVAVPPYGGRCRSFPATGNVSSTLFRLSSLDWDGDGPFYHRFFWRAGANGTGEGSWKTLSNWQMAQDVGNILFGKAGNITVRAEARDMLGSISAASTGITVLPAVPPDSQLLDVIGAVQAKGAPMAVLVALSAVADTKTSALVPARAGSAPASTEKADADRKAAKDFSLSLLGIASSSGALDDPTPEVVGAMTNSLTSILSISEASLAEQAPESTDGSTAQAPVVVDADVADKGAGLVADIAAAADTLPEGLGTEAASALVGSVGMLMYSVAEPEPASPLAANASNASANASAAAAVEKSKQLSKKLMSAISKIGDAASKALPVGETKRVSGGSLELTLAKEDPEELRAKGAKVGSFGFPPMTNLSLGRRLAACAGSSSPAGVVMQHTAWTANPFAFASTACKADSPAGTKDGACKVDGSAIESMDLKICGQEVPVKNLDENITFILWVPRAENDTENSTETRVCQYFDEGTETWSTDGCFTTEVTDDYVVCACNHLTSFGAAWRTFAVALESAVMSMVLCSNAEVMSEAGLRNLLRGEWYHTQAALLLWAFLLFLLFLSIVVHTRARSHARTLGISREALLMSLAGQKPLDKDRQKAMAEEGWARYKEACKSQNRSVIVGRVMWTIQRKLFGPAARLEDVLLTSVKDSILVVLAVIVTRRIVTTQLGLAKQDRMFLQRLQMHDAGKQPMLLKGKSFNHVKPTAFASMSRFKEQFANGLEAIQKDLSEATCSSATDADLKGPRRSDGASAWWVAFKAFHPLADILQMSMSAWWTIHVAAFGCNILGSFAISAFFLEQSSMSAGVASRLECQEKNFFANLIRDAGIAVVSSFIANVPPRGLLILHRKPVPYTEDMDRRAGRLAAKMLFDKILLSVSTSWLLLCALFTASFLANVRPSDGKHWMVAAGVLLFKSWCVIPLFLSVAWISFGRAIRASPRLKSKLVRALDGAISIALPKQEKKPRQRAVLSTRSTRIARLTERVPDFNAWARSWVDGQDGGDTAHSPREVAPALRSAATAMSARPPAPPPVLAPRQRKTVQTLMSMSMSSSVPHNSSDDDCAAGCDMASRSAMSSKGSCKVTDSLDPTELWQEPVRRACAVASSSASPTKARRALPNMVPQCSGGEAAKTRPGRAMVPALALQRARLAQMQEQPLPSSHAGSVVSQESSRSRSLPPSPPPIRKLHAHGGAPVSTLRAATPPGVVSPAGGPSTRQRWPETEARSRSTPPHSRPSSLVPPPPPALRRERSPDAVLAVKVLGSDRVSTTKR